MSLREETRRLSHEAIVSSLGEKQREVYGVYVFSPHPLGPWEVADTLNKHVYVVRPRITELVELGVIEEAGTRFETRSGKRETTYRIKSKASFDQRGQGWIFGDAA